MMVTSLSVNTAVQPALHNLEMERRLVLVSAGKRWAVLASLGSGRRSRSALRVEVMMLLSGNATFIGLLVG